MIGVIGCLSLLLSKGEKQQRGLHVVIALLDRQRCSETSTGQQLKIPRRLPLSGLS
jgi:hypothetical protein